MTPAPNWYGEANITVSLIDSADGMDSQSFDLTVTAVNDVPTTLLLSEDEVSENTPSGHLVGT